MIYNRKKSGLVIADIWYNKDETPSNRCDILRYHYISEFPNFCTSKENLWTILIDLSLTEEELLSGMDKTTKYQAKRAKERDNVHTETFLALGEMDDSKLAQYMSFFNEFAKSKDRDQIGLADLKTFYTSGTLCIRSVMENETGTVLSMHANVVSDGKARLHQSSSHFRESNDSDYRSLVGRANRYLHLDDLLYFKSIGVAFYDFGGWYGGDTDQEKIAINKFKEAFGGKKIQEYSCIVPVSFAGKISVLARKLLRGK